MTAIRPTDSFLRDQIKQDDYNETLGVIQSKFSEMDKYINNLESDVKSIRDFETSLKEDKERGFDVGSSLETLEFQKSSLEIDLQFFVNMKQVYIEKLYGDVYKYLESIIDSALAIEDIPKDSTKDSIKKRKFRGVNPFPAPKVPNPHAYDMDNNRIETEPELIADPFVTYDLQGVFTLINVVVANLTELAEDIGSFDGKIANAKEKEKRGFSVGNLLMNLTGQKEKLEIEYSSNIKRIDTFLEQNKKFSEKCLKRIQLISSEIVTKEELEEEKEEE